MNFISSIIKFILSLFGGNKPTTKPKPVSIEPAVEPPPPVVEEPKFIVDPMPIEASHVATKIYLGHCDEGVPEENLKALMKAYHRNMWGVKESVKSSKFRHGDLFEWVKIKRIPGQSVKTLQTFLVNIGIMPANSNRDGVFAYATQAAVRMFQEYIRIYENVDIKPTGIVDEATWKHMKAWQEKEKTAEKWTRGPQSPEFKKWISLLEKAKNHYQANGHPILDLVDAMAEKLNNKIKPAKVDTIPVKNWSSDPSEIHLIGIRREEETAGQARSNDDVFILLINGMVFKFWGSTDPKATKRRRRGDEAFLTEGQHKFRFGWHNISEANKAKAYQALNPFDKGVLVFRDWDDDNKLTEKDIKKGVAEEHNTTINIHWTGVGHRSTWSEGCQVIAGESYADNENEKRDCSKFAASGSAAMKQNKEDKITHTKAAYNVFTDLLLLYAPKQQDYLYYTLGRDETLSHDFLKTMGGEEMLADSLRNVGRFSEDLRLEGE